MADEAAMCPNPAQIDIRDALREFAGEFRDQE
jgi:hypothetical protein